MELTHYKCIVAEAPQGVRVRVQPFTIRLSGNPNNPNATHIQSVYLTAPVPKAKLRLSNMDASYDWSEGNRDLRIRIAVLFLNECWYRGVVSGTVQFIHCDQRQLFHCNRLVQPFVY